MKKLKPSKEVLLQYIYDYGIKDTCKLLHITEEDINSVLYPSKQEYSQHKYNYQIPEVKASIAKVISDNYNRLRSMYVGNTTNLQLSQTDEDIFHNTLLKVISDGIEDNVLQQIEYRLKMVRYQLQMDNKQLKGIQTNALSKEARENKADLY
uniref:Uncharacterized protein n=1 Tax=Siphoviridae sp. ctREU2 TaxID=2826333 RepID=A0A8S5NJS6_9CAUD|nr:MAG TPA: hypothetical protein [Siphoviridae sp. ctREU2]